MKALKIVSFTAALLLLAGVYVGGQAVADSGRQPGTMEPMHHLKAEKTVQMQDCHQMMTSLESLEEKVVAMQETRGDEQVAAIATVVEELVTQHKTMHRQMACMGSGKEKMGVLPSGDDDSLGSSLEAHVTYHF